MMKKSILFLLLISAASLMAQGNLESSDFLFMESLDPDLYPETNYQDNPAVLANITESMLIGDADFSGSFSNESKVRIDDSIGLSDGKEDITAFEAIPLVNIDVFTPGEDGKVTGLGISYDSQHNYDSTSQLNYNSIFEDSQTVNQTNTFTAGADFYLAGAVKDTAKYGFSLGYDWNMDPKEFNNLIDRTINPTLSYYEEVAGGSVIDTTGHGAHALLGFILPVETSKVYMGVVYNGLYEDKVNEYIAVDTDGDGYNETLTTLTSYYWLETAEGGPEDETESVKHEAYTVMTDVAVTTSVITPIGENTSLIIDGKYSAFNYTYEHYLLQVTNPDTVTDGVYSDDSYHDTVKSSGLGSFDLLVGFEISDPKGDKNLRLGLEYSRFSEKFSQSGDTEVGLNMYSSSNEENYSELYLGLEPVNGSIISYDLYPAETLLQQARISADYRWTPMRDFVLLVNGGITGAYDIYTYRAFNLDTRTVWEEKVSSASITWNMDSKIGVGFAMGENLFYTLNLQNLTTLGDLSFSGESHPYDIYNLRYSEDGSTYLLSEMGIDLSINMGLVASW